MLLDWHRCIIFLYLVLHEPAARGNLKSDLILVLAYNIRTICLINTNPAKSLGSFQIVVTASYEIHAINSEAKSTIGVPSGRETDLAGAKLSHEGLDQG